MIPASARACTVWRPRSIHGDLSDAQLQELQAVAQKCPVHKLMTQVTTEITTGVERLP